MVVSLRAFLAAVGVSIASADRPQREYFGPVSGPHSVAFRPVSGHTNSVPHRNLNLPPVQTARPRVQTERNLFFADDEEPAAPDWIDDGVQPAWSKYDWLLIEEIRDFIDKGDEPKAFARSLLKFLHLRSGGATKGEEPTGLPKVRQTGEAKATAKATVKAPKAGKVEEFQKVISNTVQPPVVRNTDEEKAVNLRFVEEFENSAQHGAVKNMLFRRVSRQIVHIKRDGDISDHAKLTHLESQFEQYWHEHGTKSSPKLDQLQKLLKAHDDKYKYQDMVENGQTLSDEEMEQFDWIRNFLSRGDDIPYDVAKSVEDSGPQNIQELLEGDLTAKDILEYSLEEIEALRAECSKTYLVLWNQSEHNLNLLNLKRLHMLDSYWDELDTLADLMHFELKIASAEALP